MNIRMHLLRNMDVARSVLTNLSNKWRVKLERKHLMQNEIQSVYWRRNWTQGS